MLSAVTGLLLGCSARSEPASEAPPPARRGLVVLDQDAQQRAGIQVAKISRQSVANSLRYTGWLIPIPGREAVIKAPAIGFVIPPVSSSEGEAVTLGSAVEKAARLATLEVVLSPQERSQLIVAKEEADTVIAQSQITMEMAEAQLKRYDKAGEAIPGIRVNDLRETYERAKAAIREAQEKLPFLPKEPLDDPANFASVALTTPIAGRITAVNFSPRQLVMQGDPLWTVADWSALWVRLPVFENDLPRVERAETIEVTSPLSEKPAAAHRVRAPQPADATRRTVDLFYEIENRQEKLLPGQTVQVSLPLDGASERLVAPASAVLWDGMGATSVYVQVSAEEFRRQPVELGSYIGDKVVVEKGLHEGDAVVATGAESLHGEQFKDTIQAEE